MPIFLPKSCPPWQPHATHLPLTQQNKKEQRKKSRYFDDERHYKGNEGIACITVTTLKVIT
jgi:hypothetical protein